MNQARSTFTTLYEVDIPLHCPCQEPPYSSCPSTLVSGQASERRTWDSHVCPCERRLPAILLDPLHDWPFLCGRLEALQHARVVSSPPPLTPDPGTSKLPGHKPALFYGALADVDFPSFPYRQTERMAVLMYVR